MNHEHPDLTRGQPTGQPAQHWPTADSDTDQHRLTDIPAIRTQPVLWTCTTNGATSSRPIPNTEQSTTDACRDIRSTGKTKTSRSDTPLQLPVQATAEAAPAAAEPPPAQGVQQAEPAEQPMSTAPPTGQKRPGDDIEALRTLLTYYDIYDDNTATLRDKYWDGTCPARSPVPTFSQAYKAYLTSKARQLEIQQQSHTTRPWQL